MIGNSSLAVMICNELLLLYIVICFWIVVELCVKEPAFSSAALSA